MMNVYFTVDTEASMGGAWDDPALRPVLADRHIFCRVGGKDYGIGFITEALSQYGFRATHFVETLMTEVNGAADVQPVFDYLLERGQDLQLHVHPTYHFYARALEARAEARTYTPPPTNDLLSTFDEQSQMDLLSGAIAHFERLAGRRPVAFRAGCFAANRTTLRCLHRAGLVLDSSFNPCYREWSFRDEQLIPNEVRHLDGVCVVPVTVARTRLPEGYGGLKHADPCALSFTELRTMLENGAAAGQRHFVIVFHSFSVVKTRDLGYIQLRPDRLTIRRLHRLLEYLSSRPDLYRVRTFGELAGEVRDVEAERPTPVDLPIISAGCRKFLQALNRFYWF